MPGPSWRQRALQPMVALAVAATLALAGCAFGPPNDTQSGQAPNLPTPSAPSPEGSTGDDTVGVQVLVKNLQVPWGMAFLPDGDALVTERDTRALLRITPSGRSTPVATITEAYPGEEGGLLGVAVSPKYAVDKTVFLYYTTQTDNRIASLVLGGRPKPIVTGIPVGTTDNGGRIAFGPDGYLYAGTGDAGVGSRAQNATSLGGKILRMTVVGTPAPGNPTSDSLVWSSGYRNVLGLAWDRQKRLWATDVGRAKVDEVNLVTKGGNYGWPNAEGADPDPRFVDPRLTWPTRTSTPGGAVVVGSTLIVAMLVGQRLWAITLDPKTGTVSGQPRALLAGRYGRLRTVETAPDGSVWVATSNRDGHGTPTVDDDRIVRIIPPGSSGVNVL